MQNRKGRAEKAKIARRVIEVLDYFNDDTREATVMEIARRYNRPQSSTSELLTSLVELGLLHKDPRARKYSLTPRAAMLGWSGQTDIVRDGSLVRVAENLAAEAGLPVAVFAMAGLNAQIVSLRTGSCTNSSRAHGLNGGQQVPLSTSSAGWLLLSTVPLPRRNGMVHRLNSEACEDHKFSVADMMRRLDECQERGWVEGPVSCHTGARLIARLIPVQEHDRPLALGFVHAGDRVIDTADLLNRLEDATACLTGSRCIRPSAAPFSGYGALPAEQHHFHRLVAA